MQSREMVSWHVNSSSLPSVPRCLVASLMTSSLDTSALHSSLDTSSFLALAWLNLHGPPHPGSVLSNSIGPSFLMAHDSESLFSQYLFLITNVCHPLSASGQLGGMFSSSSSCTDIWPSNIESLVGKKRHFELVTSHEDPSSLPISSSI